MQTHGLHYYCYLNFSINAPEVARVTSTMPLAALPYDQGYLLFTATFNGNYLV